MEYSKLIAVSGLSGLFELLTSKSDGAIAKSLENDTTQFISSRAHQFSHLESIEVFTTRENVFLAEVFIAMGKSKEALPNEKEAKSVEAYFKNLALTCAKNQIKYVPVNVGDNFEKILTTYLVEKQNFG